MQLTFAAIVAKKYGLIEREVIDQDIPLHSFPYNYVCEKGKSFDFLATAVEAMIGAIYKETGDLKAIKEVIVKWMQWRDEFDELFPEKRTNCSDTNNN